jgi:cell shape-determining protein MreD
VFLAAWVLGLAVDLSNVGGVGEATVVGPMSLAYLLAVAAVLRMREAFFRDRLTSQAVLALVFCLLAHGIWVTVQSLLARGQVTWPTYAATMLQAVGLACYTAVVMPLGYRLLLKCERWFVAVQPGRARRPRMVR